MNKITCDVIRDFLPLYVEQMLSEDSRKLVEEHLRNCESCRTYWEELKKEANTLEYIGDRKEVNTMTKAAFKKIRHSILKKRILSICITVLCILSAMRIGYYFYAEKETYISYEDSGLEMKGDRLYATKTFYGRMSSIISPDQTIQFLRMTETPEVKKRYPSQSCNTLVDDYGNQIDPASATELDENKIRGIKKVYYLPEEYSNYQFDYTDPKKGAAQTKELETVSTLLWQEAQ